MHVRIRGLDRDNGVGRLGWTFRGVVNGKLQTINKVSLPRVACASYLDARSMKHLLGSTTCTPNTNSQARRREGDENERAQRPALANSGKQTS